MKKRIVLWTGALFALLALALGIHIYIVTHHGPMDAHTRAMARIDIQQPVTQADADSITSWLYQQKGVDRVLVNPRSSIAVFTYFPIKTSAGRIVADFKTEMPYKAERHIPSATELKNGCPVASTSLTYKIYGFFKKIF